MMLQSLVRRTRSTVAVSLSNRVAGGNAVRRTALTPRCYVPPLLSTDTSLPRFFSANPRQEFEDAFHIGRALSRFRELQNAAKIARWKKALGPIKPLKLSIPDELLFPQAPYEAEALAQIHQRSFDCNILLEIRDVRVPASSHHPSFTRLAAHRLHLICYTHADMIDAKTRDRVEAWTLKSWPKSRCIFVDSREHRSFGIKPKPAPGTDEEEKDEEESDDDDDDEDQDEDNSEDEGEAKNDAGEEKKEEERPPLPFDMVYDSLLFHLQDRGGANAALTVGVANTGKSSLLLALIRTARSRGELPKKGLKSAFYKPVSKKKAKLGKKPKKKVTKHKGMVAVEDKPGKTREITEYLLREKPRAFFLDVPGMTLPRFYFKERPEAWFASGAANLIPLGKRLEKDVELNMAFCNYVLYAMNRDATFGYVAKLGLKEPTTDILEVLEALKPMREGKDPEHFRMKQCQSFLKLFNTGNFGPVILDDLRKPYEKFIFKDSHFKQKNDHFRKRGRDDDYDDHQEEETIDDDDEDGFYKV